MRRIWQSMWLPQLWVQHADPHQVPCFVTPEKKAKGLKKMSRRMCVFVFVCVCVCSLPLLLHNLWHHVPWTVLSACDCNRPFGGTHSAGLVDQPSVIGNSPSSQQAPKVQRTLQEHRVGQRNSLMYATEHIVRCRIGSRAALAKNGPRKEEQHQSIQVATKPCCVPDSAAYREHSERRQRGRQSRHRRASQQSRSGRIASDHWAMVFASPAARSLPLLVDIHLLDNRICVVLQHSPA